MEFFPFIMNFNSSLTISNSSLIQILTRVNSANVLDEGLRIGGRGRQMKRSDKQGEV
jgi:hypothetical protein